MESTYSNGSYLINECGGCMLDTVLCLAVSETISSAQTVLSDPSVPFLDPRIADIGQKGKHSH